MLSTLFLINMPFFFRKQLWEKWIFEQDKVECERERVLLRGGMMIMVDDEGGSVRSICIVLYT